jgi:hypothetical protein
MKRLFLLAAFLSTPAWSACSNTTFGSYTCVNSQFAFTSGTTSRTFTLSVTAGNKIVLSVFTGTNTGTLTAAAWAACGSLQNYGGSTSLTTARGIVVSATAITTGTCAITIADTVSDLIAGTMWQWSGGPTNDAGGNLTDLGSITGGATASCPAVTTTHNGDLVLCVMIDPGNNGGNWTAGTGFTGVTVTGVTLGMEEQNQATAGAITPQMKYSSTGHLGAATITFSTAALPPTLTSLNGVPVGNAPGNIKTWNGIYINPAPGYIGSINGLTTPFTAFPATPRLPLT